MLSRHFFKSSKTAVSCLLILLLASCNPLQQANKKAAKNQTRILYPNAPFDSAVAKKALTYGTTTIEGVAYTKPKTQFGYKAPFANKIFAKNVSILLFPVTPYFEEWYRLRNEKEGKRTHVYMSDEAFRFRIVEQTDEYGRFKFERMKPGRYFIQCIVTWNEQRSRDVYRGSSYGNYGTSANHYSREYYLVSKADRLEEFINVKDGQKTLEVVLK